MTEEMIQFANQVREALNGWRTNSNMIITGQFEIERRMGGKIFRVVVTNNNGKYDFDAANSVSMDELEYLKTLPTYDPHEGKSDAP